MNVEGVQMTAESGLNSHTDLNIIDFSFSWFLLVLVLGEANKII